MKIKLDTYIKKGLYYSIRKGKENKVMSYIDLDSVGSTVTNDGIVFPQDCSEAPETASDAEEMMGVAITDCDDEWFYSLSLVDGYNLLSFLEDSGLVLPNGFTNRVEGLMGSYDTLVAVS